MYIAKDAEYLERFDVLYIVKGYKRDKLPIISDKKEPAMRNLLTAGMIHPKNLNPRPLESESTAISSFATGGHKGPAVHRATLFYTVVVISATPKWLFFKIFLSIQKNTPNSR